MSVSGRLEVLHLVQQLSTLPREIVDKIVDNLSLFKVLQLATWNDPATTTYILQHRHYGRVFLSARQVERAASRFALWCQLKIACGWRNDRHLFAINPTSSLFGNVNYVAVMNDMLQDIKKGYLRGAAYAQILSQFSPEPISPSVDESRLKQDFQKMWAAQEAMKELQSQQLSILADFVETYPRMLRWAYDPRGDRSTIPPEHISMQLRARAKKVSNTQYVRLRRPVYCMFLFRNGIMPLVPRKQCLQLLLQSDLPVDVLGLATSHQEGVEQVTEVLQRTSLGVLSRPIPGESGEAKHANEPVLQAPTKDQFPLHVMNDLRTVFRGLMHRYVRPDQAMDGTPSPRLLVPDRIKTAGLMFTKSSAERRRILDRDAPSFVVPPRSEFQLRAEHAVMKEYRCIWSHKKVEQIQLLSLRPYHEREVEWLGAFLRSVAYLETLEMPKKGQPG